MGPAAGALLVAAVLVVQTGCAGQPRLSPAVDPAAVEPVMIVASERELEVRLEGFARGRVEGGVAGASEILLPCAIGLSHGTCAGPYCGAAAMLWLAICGVAGVASGVAGAAVSAPAETVREAERALATAISPRTIQAGLRDQVVAAGRRHGLALSQHPETIVETTLVRVGTSGKGYNSPLVLEMQGQARVLRARDRAELHAVNLSYQGEAHRLERWAANNGALLLRELERGYQALGEALYEASFQLYPYPHREPAGAGVLAVAFGLAPEYPETRGTLTEDNPLARRFEWTVVDSTRPLLRWQPFPRAADVAEAPAEMARVRAVTYDLVVARERNLAPTSELYRRERLLEPYHRPEVALAPGAYYFWSVRARFEIDGRERVTEWSTTHYAALGAWHAPSTLSYRFRTP